MISKKVWKELNYFQKTSFKCLKKWIRFISKIKRLFKKFKLLNKMIKSNFQLLLHQLKLLNLKIKIFTSRSHRNINKLKWKRPQSERLRTGSYSSVIKLSFWITYLLRFIIYSLLKNWTFLCGKLKYLFWFCQNGNVWLLINLTFD